MMIPQVLRETSTVGKPSRAADDLTRTVTAYVLSSFLVLEYAIVVKPMMVMESSVRLEGTVDVRRVVRWPHVAGRAASHAVL
jgi:hypothetical protein